MMKKPIIGFISQSEPNDKRALSGTIYKLYEQIKASGAASEIIWIKAGIPRLTRVIQFLLNVMLKPFGWRVLLSHSTYMAKRFSASLSRQDIERADVLFAPFASGHLYKIETTRPIIYLTDATFHAMMGYYASFSGLSSFSARQGDKVEQVALDKSWRIITSSDWARNSMVNDYGIDASKIRMIEFGANVDKKDIILREPRKEGDKKLQLLFLGVDWERKGGDVAVDCLIKLRQMGVDAELYVIGVTPPKKYRKVEGLHSVGFLNKNISEHYDRFISIVRHSDLLILPTRAECAGIAFCEASAYGLPSFTYDTGGVPNYVENGVNGYRLPLTSDGEDFARKIKETLDKGEFRVLCEGARMLYKTKLNWTVWRQRFKELLNELS